MTRFVVIGAGGHGKVVVATLQAAGQAMSAVMDSNPERVGSTVLGIPVQLLGAGTNAEGPAVIGVGDNAARKALAGRLAWDWATAIHPTAIVHESVTVEPGAVVFAGAIIQPGAHIRSHAIVNTGARVDHDCDIEAFAHVAPGVSMSGGVRVGEGALVGVGASIAPGCTIGAWSIIGAGAVVTTDIPDHVTAVGVPARVIKTHKPEAGR